MGIIQRQAIKGTIYTYIGVVIGFVTAGILFPNILLPEQIGVTKLLVTFSLLFARLADLGFTGVANRLFTYFRNKEKKHNGFLFIALSVALVGFLISIILYFILKPYIIEDSIGKYAFFVEYIYYLIPLIFFTLIFNTLDTYNKVLYDAILGTFIKEFIQRVLIFFSIVLYCFDILNFNGFVFAYTASLSIPALIILISLIQRKQFSLKPQLSFISNDMAKTMLSVSFYSIILGFSGIIILHIDSIMIYSLIDLGPTGIYSITFFFGTLIIIPSRSLLRIATPIIADSWKKKDLNTINVVYYKSCLNQLIVGSLLFIGLWANIHNVFKILPEEYEAGRYVIFFISLAYLFDMASGVNGFIILTSKYYKALTYYMFLFVAFVVITNYIFIPRYGIVGAAMASALSKFLFNLIKYLFLLVKFRMQPFDSKYLIVLLIAGVSFLAGYIIPEFDNFVIDIIIRSIIITSIFGVLTLTFKVSEDVNLKAKSMWEQVRRYRSIKNGMS